MSNLRDQLQIARINTMRQRARRQLHLASCEACRQRMSSNPLGALFARLLGDEADEPAQIHPTSNKAH